MQKYFVNESIELNKTFEIESGDQHHIEKVMRNRNGDQIICVDLNHIQYLCTIENVQAGIILPIEKLDINNELDIEVTLVYALPKGDKMETIIQKMVELGACEIAPVSTKRCIVKLDAKKAESKVRRWNAIAESAAKQSKRGIIPKVLMPVSFAQALDRAKDMDMVLIPYEEAENMSVTREVFSEIKPGMKIGIFIGPEGGFAESEVEEAKKIGARAITLGRRILRTETAGMATMSVLMYLMEE